MIKKIKPKHQLANYMNLIIFSIIGKRHLCILLHNSFFIQCLSPKEKKRILKCRDYRDLIFRNRRGKYLVKSWNLLCYICFSVKQKT